MFLKAGAISLVLLLASRLLGLARESAQAAAFGTSGLADVAVLMLTLPDWLTGVLFSGALAYVLLPRWATQDRVQQADTQRRVALTLMLGAVVIGVLMVIARTHLVALLAPGLTGALLPVADLALVWSAAAFPAALLAALWATRLQHERDFLGMYGANLVVNGVLVVALVWGVSHADAAQTFTQLGIWLMLAMLARLAWLGVRQPAQPVRSRVVATPRVPLPATPVWLWAALSAGLPLALPFAARSMVSHVGEGELATFNYAWKLIELPLMLAIQLVATLSFPAITRAFAGESVSSKDADTVVRQAFALAWALACACVAGLLVAAPAVANLLFGWGKMSPASVGRIGQWGMTGAWSLLPQAVIAVALTVLATQQRMKLAVGAYALALAVLLWADHWTEGNGQRQMVVLNLVITGVALAVLAALGRPALRWLPWQTLVAPTLLMLVVAGGSRTSWLAGWAPTSADQIGLACAVAVAILLAAWLTRARA